MRENKVFIIAGPSGVGKNSIINHLFKKFSELRSIPTYTTRPPRSDDKLDRVRISITEKKFKEMVDKNELIEWKKIHQWYYGKKIDDANAVFKNGKDLLLEIDVQGLSDYRKFFNNVCAIFVRYEKLDNLKERLRKNRPDITEDDLKIRYQSATKEMKYMDKYDFVITNIEGKPETAIKEIEKIIKGIIPQGKL